MNVVTCCSVAEFQVTVIVFKFYIVSPFPTTCISLYLCNPLFFLFPPLPSRLCVGLFPTLSASVSLSSRGHSIPGSDLCVWLF